jgi:hypothetical protein
MRKTTTGVGAAAMAAAAAVVASAAGLASAQAVTTFDNGTEGWSVSGRDDIAPTGNPGNGLDVQLIDVFGADIRNNTNAAFLGDYTRFGTPIELSIDIKVNTISSPFFPGELPRELVVELRDYTNNNGYPWTGVWFSLGVLDASVNNDWVTYSVIIDDPTSLALPAGWGGTGDEDPNTFEPVLPADRTFTSVLQSVDEIAFTTFVPGFFFGFTNFELQVDNIALRAVPAPGSLAVLAGAGLLAGRRRRR